MKRLTAIIVSALILLSSCGKETFTTRQENGTFDSAVSNEVTSSNDESGRLISFLNISNNGELFIDSQTRLNFFDFTIMDSVVICSKPNCPHNDENSCSSFGMHRDPFIQDGHIYFFETDAYMDKNKPVFNTNIVRADIDGTNRKVILTLEDKALSSSNILLMGDTLYFGLRTLDYNELSINSDDSTAMLYSYNLKTDKLTELFSMKEGYNCSAQIDGLFCGEIYFEMHYQEEKREYNPDEFVQPIFNTNYYKYNPYDGTISERDGEYYPFSGCVIHFEDEGITFYFENGRELYISDISTKSTYISIINDFIIDTENKFAVEISSGKRYAVDGIETGDSIIYYMDGSYVIKSFDENSGAYGYRKIDENELIGAEIT